MTVKVTCSAFVDNILHSVYYGDTELDVIGNTGKESEIKTFSFKIDQTSTEANKLKVEVEDHQNEDHCSKAGFILQCKAKDQTGKDVESSPWHKFISNTNNWQSKEGSELCKVPKSGTFFEHTDHSGVSELLSAGAIVIWTKDKKSTVLIGSPSSKGNFT